MPSVVLTLLALLHTLLAQAPDSEHSGAPVNKGAPGFHDKTIAIGGTEHRYVVYVPSGYTEDRRWPLIMFLHGMGECGTDGKKQTEVGLGSAIRKDAERWPFVVVFPQKPDKESQWADHEALVLATLAATEKEHRIDERRRFLTGLSQGGAGTWALGSKHADKWAAIAPVCGYGKPADIAPALKEMPIWAFHGVDDPVVPAKQSKNLCAAVEQAGGNSVLTLYEKTAHNSWDKAYRESNLAEWFRLLPSELTFARVLSDPERVPGIRSLEFTVVSRARASADRTSLGSPGNGEWRRGLYRMKDDAEVPVSGPFGDVVPADAATRCLAECVRLLSRAGALDAEDAPEPAEGDYVVVDRMTGLGRSVDSFPKHFPTGTTASPQVDAIRKAIELIKNLR